MKLTIPNLEIRDIFVTQIMEFFKENVRRDGDTLNRFCNALQNGDMRQTSNPKSADFLRIHLDDPFLEEKARVSETLSGRIGIVELAGLSLREVM